MKSEKVETNSQEHSNNSKIHNTYKAPLRSSDLLRAVSGARQKDYVGVSIPQWWVSRGRYCNRGQNTKLTGRNLNSGMYNVVDALKIPGVPLAPQHNQTLSTETPGDRGQRPSSGRCDTTKLPLQIVRYIQITNAMPTTLSVYSQDGSQKSGPVLRIGLPCSNL